MSILDYVRRGAIYYGNRPSVMFEDQQLTFEEVYVNGNRIANALQQLGIKKGDKVAFLLTNSLESMEISFGQLFAGIARVPLNVRLSINELQHMINETEAKALLFTEEFVNHAVQLKALCPTVEIFAQMNGTPEHDWIINMSEAIAAASSEEPSMDLDPSDILSIQYTSGTSGVLKAVVHTEEAYRAIINNILVSLDIVETDTMLHAAPLTHASGTFLIPHWISGATNHILSGFEPTQYLSTIHESKPTRITIVPTMLAMLLAQKDITQYSFDSIRDIIYGTSPMPKELLQRGIDLWGPKFIQFYGSTEAPVFVTKLTKEDHIIDQEEDSKRLLSCGRPVSTAAVKIVDEQGEEVSTGNIGEITIKADHTMSSYWKAPELTEETIKDGWIYSGNLGYFDHEGYLYLVDRKSDMIISGGFNIYPREVEEIIYQHPSVLEVGVVGVPHEKWVETVKAFVVLREGESVTEQEIIDFCQDRIASYKKPTQVEFIDELPKTSVGKVVRRLLREAK